MNLFNRSISKEMINKSIAIVCMSFVIVFTSTVMLSACTDTDFMKIAYEVVSAGATVGLSMGLTPTLNVFGKLIIIITMYLGRVGPISLAVMFNLKKEKKNVIRNPIGDISVG